MLASFFGIIMESRSISLSDDDDVDDEERSRSFVAVAATKSTDTNAKSVVDIRWCCFQAVAKANMVLFLIK